MRYSYCAQEFGRSSRTRTLSRRKKRWESRVAEFRTASVGAVVSEQLLGQSVVAAWRSVRTVKSQPCCRSRTSSTGQARWRLALMLCDTRRLSPCWLMVSAGSSGSSPAHQGAGAANFTMKSGGSKYHGQVSDFIRILSRSGRRSHCLKRIPILLRPCVGIHDCRWFSDSGGSRNRHDLWTWR